MRECGEHFDLKNKNVFMRFEITDRRILLHLSTREKNSARHSLLRYC